MNKRVWIAGVIAAVLLLITVGMAAAAPGDPAGPGPRDPGQRPGLRAVMNAVIAETGLTIQEVREQLRDGQTLAAIIEANGGSVQAVIDAAVSAATEQINQAVSEGRITQEQADQLLSQLPDRITRLVNGELPERGERRPLVRPAERILVQAVADATGLEPSAVLEQLRDGQTLADVLTANGVDVNTFIDAAVAKVEERLAQAVANGRLTQEQADERVQQFRERLAEQIDNPVGLETAPAIGA